MTYLYGVKTRDKTVKRPCFGTDQLSEKSFICQKCKFLKKCKVKKRELTLQMLKKYAKTEKENMKLKKKLQKLFRGHR